MILFELGSFRATQIAYFGNAETERRAGVHLAEVHSSFGRSIISLLLRPSVSSVYSSQFWSVMSCSRAVTHGCRRLCDSTLDAEPLQQASFSP